MSDLSQPLACDVPAQAGFAPTRPVVVAAGGVRLIVNADDLGLSPAISDAIFESHHRGIVTSASLLANMPDAPRAAALACRMPGLAVGLHFCLTQGQPVSSPADVPTLVGKDGTFLPKSFQFARLRDGAASPHDVERELGAQVRRMLELGLSPTHVDGHHGVQYLPAVERVLTRSAERLRLPATRSRLGYPVPGPHARAGDRLRCLVAHVRDLAEIAEDWLRSRRVRRAGLRVSDGQLGRMRLYPNPQARKPALLARLESVSGGSYELILHPGPPGDDPGVPGSQARRRVEDARLAMDAGLRSLIDRLGVELISYRQL